MATKSIINDVRIKDKSLAATFVQALTEVERTKYEPTRLTRECTEITGDKVKELFGKR